MYKMRVVFAGGITVIITRKWSHTAKPQVKYGVELTTFLIVWQFLENGDATLSSLFLAKNGKF